MMTEELRKQFNTLLELKHSIEKNQNIQYDDLANLCSLIEYKYGEEKIKKEMINCINAEIISIFEKSTEE